MRILRSLVVAFAAIVCAPKVSFAGGAVSLPIGDLVSYGGAECGKIKGTWYAGAILGNGKFTPLSNQVTALKKKLRQTTNLKKRRKLKNQIRTLNSRIGTEATICLQLDSGVVPPTSPQAQAAGATAITWTTNLLSSSLAPGAQAVFYCPPNGFAHALYGTFTYTMDSGVCYAAAHAGVISTGVGGNVLIRVKPGQSSYLGSLRNSIFSNNWGVFDRSFAILNPANGNEIGSNAPYVIGWTTEGAYFRNQNGLLLTYLCPANGSPDSIWGTGTYTDDSSICTAAVHMGRISFRKGGIVNARITPGLTSYAASSRNGVNSNSYGNWSGSFTIE